MNPRKRVRGIGLALMLVGGLTFVYLGAIGYHLMVDLGYPFDALLNAPFIVVGVSGLTYLLFGASIRQGEVWAMYPMLLIMVAGLGFHFYHYLDGGEVNMFFTLPAVILLLYLLTGFSAFKQLHVQEAQKEEERQARIRAERRRRAEKRQQR